MTKVNKNLVSKGDKRRKSISLNEPPTQKILNSPFGKLEEKVDKIARVSKRARR